MLLWKLFALLDSVNIFCIFNEYIILQFARTELIKNDQNPKFTKAIQMEYRFEEAQKLKFAVYDLDNESASLADDDFLGALECSLGEVQPNWLCWEERVKHRGTKAIQNSS